MTTDNPSSTGNRPRPLSDLVPALTKGVFGQKNLLFGKLLADWPAIAGADVAAISFPLELKFARPPKGKDDKPAKTPAKPAQAVLHLAVRPAHALELSYQKALLVERLNIFFGYSAIKDLKFIQHSEFKEKKQKPAPRITPLSISEEKQIDALVGQITESDLQTALKNLGKAIISRRDKGS